MIGESSGNTIDATTCRWCGCIHAGTCHRVEEIEYYPNGTIKRVRLREAMPEVSVPTISVGAQDIQTNVSVAATWDGEAGDWSWSNAGSAPL